MMGSIMGIDLKFLGPLAERAVVALESMATSFETIARTAELQAQILGNHNHNDDTQVLANVMRLVKDSDDTQGG